MLNQDRIWIGNTQDGQHLTMLPSMANRHGLIAGATGTGKTVTLKVMAEAFSDLGVPVFLADVKGDLAGIMQPGTDSEDMQERIARFGLEEAGFSYKGYPVTFWDVYGQKGIPLRTTVSEMGPLLLARILGLNDLQSHILSIVFRIADDNDLLLVDTKDLKAMLNYVQEHSKEYAAQYGRISSASIGAIIRALVSLEVVGGEYFFGEPALNIQDWLSRSSDGRGMINILASDSLINNGTLYSTFLLWLLSELFESLPEVGDLSVPKVVFFFDEAHLLFSGASKVLLEKIEQVVKLIRSRGVGVYFCTQSPRDIPEGVLAQLGNKIEHGLRAYTPNEQKAVRAIAAAFRANPDFDTAQTILDLGTGEAVVSFLEEGGIPGVVQKAYILPPQSSFGAIDDYVRERAILESFWYSRYAEATDPDSAYEFLMRKGIEEEEAAEAARLEKEAAKQAAAEEKEAAKKAAAEEKEAARKAAAEEKEAAKAEAKKKKATQQAVSSVGNTVMGTVGREVGKTVGSQFGKFGKTLGGNVGASLGRGLFSTLFKRK